MKPMRVPFDTDSDSLFCAPSAPWTPVDFMQQAGLRPRRFAFLRSMCPWRSWLGGTLISLGFLGCSYDFDAPFAGPGDAGMSDEASSDVVIESGDATLEADTAGDAPVDVADAPVDVSADSVDAPDDAPVDGSEDVLVDAPDAPDAPDALVCSGNTKPCGGACVPMDSPDYGCNAIMCAPCDLPHAEATCAGGSCAIGACAGSWIDCNLDDKDGCETPIAALVPITGVDTSATAYACCPGERCSCNVVDGDPSTSWGSWECAEGGQLCTLSLSFPATGLARMVIHQENPPPSMAVRFGSSTAYFGAGSSMMDIVGSKPQGAQSAALEELAFPGGGLWWQVSEVELYRCP